jgi:hypothetical protein
MAPEGASALSANEAQQNAATTAISLHDDCMAACPLVLENCISVDVAPV